MKKVSLRDHFTWGNLARYVAPSVVMMVFTSLYTVVDGIFVSNYTGKTPFAAVNLIFPVIAIYGAFGFMFGTGGTALVTKTIGEGDRDRANRIFSLLVFVTLGLGGVIALVGALTMRPLAIALGASGELLEEAVVYGVVFIVGTPAFVLQSLFQSFFAAADKPRLGLLFIVAAGLTNILLDGILVAALRLGVAGAALASVLAQMVGGLIPLVYFVRPNGSLLRLCATRWEGKAVFKSALNGSSELLVNISFSIVNMIFNMQLLKLAGENGIAAYGFIMYVCFFFLAAFFGYDVGMAPIVGYNLGLGNKEELHNIFVKSLWIVLLGGLAMLALAEGLAVPLGKLYVGYDPELLAMSVRGFRIYAVGFAVVGLNIWGSAFFTALNNGVVSGALAISRTFAFEMICIFLLPMALGLDGVWWTCAVSEGAAAVVTVGCLAGLRRRYGY